MLRFSSQGAAESASRRGVYARQSRSRVEGNAFPFIFGDIIFFYEKMRRVTLTHKNNKEQQRLCVSSHLPATQSTLYRVFRSPPSLHDVYNMDSIRHTTSYMAYDTICITSSLSAELGFT